MSPKAKPPEQSEVDEVLDSFVARWAAANYTHARIQAENQVFRWYAKHARRPNRTIEDVARRQLAKRDPTRKK